ncbi:thiamine phosphate synthase [Brevundimonas sp. NPDC092305]|uniref:thiamine phosphate synthase n=1 Tax=Brevundimonas sp. NPDC092305 TaxID=3363957 RepID=UPI0037F8BD5D
MERSDAEILWEVASVLSRDAAKVSHGRALPPLLFFTDPVRTPRPWEVAARLPAGSGVVYRAFGATDARETALRLREATQGRVTLLVGLDGELAQACHADGLHLPERALDRAAALRAAHPGWLLTGAVHGRQVLSKASELDAAVLSPVFPAGGASADRPELGVEVFSDLVGRAPCPVYALGGINARNAAGLIGSHACGIAAIGSIQSAFGAD